MKSVICAAASAAVFVLAVAAHAADDAAAKQKPIERGKYLIDTMGCHDCHSPKAADVK